MGVQQVQDVTLIRHAYIRAGSRNRGSARALRSFRKAVSFAETGARPVLIGTWADVIGAIRFYKQHGFHVVRPGQKDRLLRRHWTVSERQVEASVVLAD